MRPMEAELGKRLLNGFKAIEAVFAAASYAMVAVLGALYSFGALGELWVVFLPAAQHLVLKLVIGGYYGAKVAPRIIEEMKGSTAD
ncbi:MAG: hypothetical protein ACRBN8_18705 [Nannocystales bacterium]